MHDKYIKMASLQKHLHKLEDPDNDHDAPTRMQLEEPTEDDVKKVRIESHEVDGYALTLIYCL